MKSPGLFPRMKSHPFPCAVLALVLLAASAAAEVRVEVMETDPTSPTILKSWESFYLRVRYETDRPIRVKARAFLDGKEVTTIAGGSPRYDDGKGETLVWLSFAKPARVDRVVVNAEDARTPGTLAETALAVDLTWIKDQQSVPRIKPKWVTQMQAHQDRLVETQLAARSEGHDGAGTPGVPILVFGVPLYLILHPWALWRLRGRWRLAAAVPLVPMLGVLGYTIIAFLAGSHLFPPVLVLSASATSLYLGALLVAYHFRDQP